jgi:hypothetical protein
MTMTPIVYFMTMPSYDWIAVDDPNQGFLACFFEILKILSVARFKDSKTAILSVKMPTGSHL